MTWNLRLWTVIALTSAIGVSAAAEKTKSSGLDKLKKLSGTWVMIDEKGKPTEQVVSVFRVTAGGSAVEETIFPGSGHEMVSIYHQDGPDVFLTHYCAAGNQPHMKLDPASPANRLEFKFVRGSNMDAAKDMHMHEGSITFIDDDHIEWLWQGWKGGKASDGHKAFMKLARKK